MRLIGNGRPMLREIRQVRQISGEPTRRWFTDAAMDLVVWLDSDAMIGFQLSYDKPHAEKAVTWRSGVPGLLHAGVDDGEGRAGKFKGTPILVAGGALDAWHVCGRFLGASPGLPADLRAFIARKLTAAGNVQ